MTGQGHAFAGERFGRFVLCELIGEGGMGQVYRAVDTVKNREVAVKRLPPLTGVDRAAFEGRFRRESALAAQLSDPHVIPIHDYGDIEGQLYIEMRYVAGGDLATRIRNDGVLSPVRAVSIIAQVASALDTAHEQGMVHRDIKPSNVLVTRPRVGAATEDFAYLSDFGIAKALTGATPLTLTGATIGTLAYMAPERFLGEGDHRSDIYSLACLLYESLTGRQPFDGNDLPQLMYAHLNLPPPRAADHSRDVPSALDDVIARGMAKEPEGRHQSAAEFATAALTACHSDSRIARQLFDTRPPRDVGDDDAAPPPPVPDAGQPPAATGSRTASPEPLLRLLVLADVLVVVAVVALPIYHLLYRGSAGVIVCAVGAAALRLVASSERRWRSTLLAAVTGAAVGLWFAQFPGSRDAVITTLLASFLLAVATAAIVFGEAAVRRLQGRHAADAARYVTVGDVVMSLSVVLLSYLFTASGFLDQTDFPPDTLGRLAVAAVLVMLGVGVRVAAGPRGDRWVPATLAALVPFILLQAVGNVARLQDYLSPSYFYVSPTGTATSLLTWTSIFIASVLLVVSATWRTVAAARRRRAGSQRPPR